jgi:prepilin-type N-terminal cleavage/methylation domain-containing protein/prepilin-type processing-associated H-X9-DG protein
MIGPSHPLTRRRGFTLVELLVVISVVGVLIALLLPAVQAAREAARCIQCKNNLKQIALAALNYHDVNNALPQGIMDQQSFPTPSPYPHTTTGSIFVSLLPYLEEKPVFDAVNFNLNMYNAPNFTISGVGIGALWCPSDFNVSQSKTLPDGSLLDPGAVTMHYSSYAGNAGTWFLDWGQQPVPQDGKMNGLFHINSAVTFAQITDGTSNTMAFGERAHSLLDDVSALYWHWWTSGNYGDTLFCTLFPMNSFRKTSSIYGTNGNASTDPYVSGASSLHPGGCNFAFADGSVWFIKDSINTWPYDQQTGLPSGLTYDPNGLYKGTPSPGVYPTLSTRASGEVISADAY